MSMTERPEDVWARTKSMFEAGADGPPLTLGPYFAFIVRKSPRRLLHMLSYYKFAAKMIGERKRILEVGCSEGFGTQLLAEFAVETVGIDYDEAAIATANATVARENLRFVCGDVMAAGLSDFDAAVALDVIEHVERKDEDAFVASMCSALDRRGIAIIGTPNETSNQYASPHTRAGHINLYSADRLRALGEKHFENVFMFSANDEVVHTGFAPMAHYLIALCVAPKAPR